jgi:phospho-N-acetylmuramoyl-pentapeptide-transferase
MIYYLLLYFRDFVTGSLGFYAWQEVMFRCIMAALTGLIVAWVSGPKIIRWLMTKKIGDRPEFHHETLNNLNREKTNTPTMGGLIILLAVFISTFLWAKLGNPFVQKGLILMIWFGAIGAADDWLKLTSKIRNRSRNGLKP